MTRHSGIRSFARSAAQAAALGASSLALMGEGAWAQAPCDDQGITVVGERSELESPRYTAPLADMPQTVTVVPREVIAQQNLLNLRDILSTLPGITFGAGEGGGGYGDSINLRGYSANNDISTDGVRDSAQYNRTDPFNLEQIEVTSGANSVYGGAGSVGGSINLVTKRPQGREGGVVTGAAGTDAYARATLDIERALAEGTAARLNLMAHENDAPGRDVETYSRWGAAPSLTFGLDAPTQVTLLYAHQEDDNIPQYGVPYALGPFNDGPLPGSDPSFYYGYSNIDRQEIRNDSLTAIVEHSFNDTFSVRNLTRWQRVTQLSIVNPPQGTWCIDSGINPWTGEACAAPGTYQPSGPRGTARDTENQILVNQTDFRARFDTGGAAHTLVAGFVFSEESYQRVNGNVLRNALGETPNPTLPVMDISAPDHIHGGPVNFIATQTADGDISNRAFYVFDRVQFGDHWEINGGVRYERNEGRGSTAAIETPYPAPPAAPVVTQNPFFHNADDLVSYRVGVVYKPTETASLYVAYGTSETPSLSTVNGTCDVLASCNVDPEEAAVTEIGAKWETFGRRLLLTAALFHNERTNFRVASGDPLIPEQQLDGQSRVDGLALSAVGRVSERWSVFANYAFLDSELVQNISDTAIGGGEIDFRAGDPLPATPAHSGSVWTAYEVGVGDGLTLGYGVTYQGELTFNRISAADPLFYTEPYWVHRAMASYPLFEHVTVQLNVNNLFDEVYYERIRNNATNGWATPGPGRSAVVSLSYEF